MNKKFWTAFLIGSLFAVALFLPSSIYNPAEYEEVLIECEQNENITCFIDDYSDSGYILFILCIVIPIVIVVGFLCLYLPSIERSEDDSNE